MRAVTSSSDRESAVLGCVSSGLFPGGQWRPATGDGLFEVEDPAAEQLIATAADATATDGRAALDAAVAVWEQWAATPSRDRGELLLRTFELSTVRSPAPPRDELDCHRPRGGADSIHEPRHHRCGLPRPNCQ
jgi:hypothetical protein